MAGRPLVGVLALQGAFLEHEAVLRGLGADTVQIRTPTDLAGIEALVLPGGESTVMSMMLTSTGLWEALNVLDLGELPILATCAGAILLAKDVLDGRPDQGSFGLVDLSVRRNGYGRQIDSFESPVELDDGQPPFPGVFIRAPIIERAGPGVTVLARVAGPAGPTPVLCRAGNAVVATFHPELTRDGRIHRLAFGSLLGDAPPASGAAHGTSGRL
ncbi:pyridoxal 5'-phosphate synthase glutaminase subunit PdxT [Actinomadura sp. KC216]|uniref:pyridoxal 5'-phosphate synthase glutaminase subunit PdxT n=1 Tax=Actinomadura sp. KC216 TaxID=2530370 RepID=UPI0010477C8C|nr:pyridoxal 5'-phosphate synthase glutaminase subunit PdxT [Actinomadura sp. KC216]TDB90345.1 pyridoxal 5'-phosphate synthase glutaminase subunit PdxT [Actinomadura sp. KC216]